MLVTVTVALASSTPPTMPVVMAVWWDTKCYWSMLTIGVKRHRQPHLEPARRSRVI